MKKKPLIDDAEADLQAIKRVEDMEDLKDARAAKEEAKREGTTTLSDLKKELGL